MAEAPFQVILDVIISLINRIGTTFEHITAFFGKLAQSLGIPSFANGVIVFGVAILIVAVVGYLIARFLLGGGKIVIPVVLGILALFILILSALAG